MNSLKLKIIAFLVLFLLGVLSASAEETEKDCVYYFYGQECLSCQETNALLEKLELKYPELQINKLEVYHNGENARLMYNYFTSYKIPEYSQGVPAVFIGRTYLIGKDPITQLLEGSITENAGVECPEVTPEGKEEIFGGLFGEKEPRHILELLTFPVITSAALHDSLTSSGLLLMLVLSGSFLFLKRKEIKQRSLYFILGALIIITAYGLRLLPKVEPLSFFAEIIAFAGLLISIKEIRSFFKTNIAKAAKENKTVDSIKSAARLVLSPIGMFLLGMVSGFLALPSLGKAFSILRDFSTEPFTRATALPLLVYFIIIYFFSLIAIIILVCFIEEKFLKDAKSKANSLKDQARWENHAFRLSHLVTGLFILIVSLLILIF